MLFLNHLMLWGLLAASIPVIIHLLNRRRHKTLRWAAMQFLLKATRESRGKKKLRHFLILACRTLGVAALVLEKVRDSMRSLGSARLVLVDSATGEPQDIASPDVLADISTTAATDADADFPALLTRAAEYLQDTPGRAEIWLASDLQASNWRHADERWAAARAAVADLPQKPAIRVLSVAGPASANVALDIIGARRAGDELLLDVELLQTTEARGAANIPLSVNLGGAQTTDTLTMPGQTLRLQKRIPLPPGSDYGHGWLAIPADGNERDNVAFFAYGPSQPVRTVVVAPRGEAAAYLALAAAPPDFGRQQAEVLEPAQALTLKTTGVAAILWAAPLPAGAASEMLSGYLKSGGQVVFLPPGSAPASPFLDHNWQPVEDSEKDKYFIVKEWNRADGPLRDGLDGSPIPADRLKAIRRQVPTGDASVLARWEDGQPFLSRLIVERGTAWFAATLPDYTWSNLGDGDILLPFLQRIVIAGAERFDSDYIAAVGSDLARPLAAETLTRLDDHGTPDPANAAHSAGVFRIGERLIALNRPAMEKEIEVLTREQLDIALDGTAYTLLEQAGKADDPTLSRDVWRAFLVGLILLLIAEALLCLPSKTTVKVLEPQTGV